MHEEFTKLSKLLGQNLVLLHVSNMNLVVSKNRVSYASVNLNIAFRWCSTTINNLWQEYLENLLLSDKIERNQNQIWKSTSTFKTFQPPPLQQSCFYNVHGLQSFQ